MELKLKLKLSNLILWCIVKPMQNIKFQWSIYKFEFVLFEEEKKIRKMKKRKGEKKKRI